MSTVDNTTEIGTARRPRKIRVAVTATIPACISLHTLRGSSQLGASPASQLRFQDLRHSLPAFIRLLCLLAIPILLGLLGTVAQTGLAQSATTQVSGAGTGRTSQGSLCDPTWGVVSSPNSNLRDNRLNGVAVVSANDVWAVGSYDNVSGSYLEATLIEHWNGSSWSAIPSANTGGIYGQNRLYGVAAASANDAWAVGYYDTGGSTPKRTLIEHWNGSSWSIVNSPNSHPSYNILYGVAIVSDNDVWAVGQSGTEILIEHWDGVQWNVVASPISEGILHAVEANGANDVWAVGAHAAHALTLHWDGVEWTRVSPPPLSRDRQTLKAVAIVSATDAWAVGSASTDCIFCASQTFIKHWDGSSWSIVDSPSPGTSSNTLNGVTVVSANDVWAVGFYGSTDGYFKTLIEHWDGSSWSVVSSPSPGTFSNILNGVAVVSTEDMWAVGSYKTSGSADRTLIERYTVCVPTPTPTPVPCTPGVFSDVPRDNPFYPYVTCLVNRGIISGYADCTFRPNNQVTRSQLAKIVSNAAGFQEDPGAQIFEDVAPDNAFYQWINRLSRRGFMGGYSCGGPGEPCVNGNRPYFRPVANATRGQTSKIVANTAGYLEEPSGQSFEDVPPTHTFYREIQRLAVRNIMGGYPCGGNGEPCLSGKPYFRPQNNVTRGQSAKIVANTFYPNCQPPAR